MIFRPQIRRLMAFSMDNNGTTAVEYAVLTALICTILFPLVINLLVAISDTRGCPVDATDLAPLAAPGEATRQDVECWQGASTDGGRCIKAAP